MQEDVLGKSHFICKGKNEHIGTITKSSNIFFFGLFLISYSHERKLNDRTMNRALILYYKKCELAGWPISLSGANAQMG